MLDQAGHPPRAVFWLLDAERDSWRLWVVPSQDLTDAHEFYRQVSTLLTEHKTDFSGLDIGDVDLRPADHPVVQALAKTIRVGGISRLQIGSLNLNGFYVGCTIIIRMDP